MMEKTGMPAQIAEQAAEFIGALAAWQSTLPSISWRDVLAHAQPEHIMLFSVDMINGF